MDKEYLLILPNVFIVRPLDIGNITLQNFGLENEKLADNKNRELLLNVQQMLMNKGYSGIFTYSFFQTNVNFHKIVLKMRIIMTIFRYVTIEKTPELSLETLAYYLLEPIKMNLDEPKMKYSLSGVQDGVRDVHFWAPGIREVINQTSHPENLYLDNEHFLIQKFNAGELEDKYIIAIERFNRTFKNDYDLVEDILNLTTAFEHILEKADTSDSFAKSLVQVFGLEYPDLDSTMKNLTENFEKWSKEFYQIRGEISHGNAFKKYSEKRGYNYWEECFKWKHPTGIIRYVSHISIAKKIFRLLIERLLGDAKIEKVVVQKASSEVKHWLEEVECRILLENEIEPLITPNEVYYRKLKELVDSKEPFGLPYYEIVWKIKRYDGTEEKVVLLYLLKHFSNLTEERFPDLKIECKEIKKLVEEENITLLSVKAIELSQKIYKKDFDKKVFDDEEVYNSNLAQFFEKIFYSLSQIAWLEKLKSSS